jgi:hypothetical protein
MKPPAPAKDAGARHPVAAFRLIGVGVYVVAVPVTPLRAVADLAGLGCAQSFPRVRLRP